MVVVGGGRGGGAAAAAVVVVVVGPTCFVRLPVRAMNELFDSGPSGIRTLAAICNCYLTER